MFKRALIVWGGIPGHKPEACSRIIAEILQEEGISAEITGNFSAFADPDIGRFDLIVPMITNSTIKKPELDNLVEAVRSGVGLAGCHGALAASFRQETAFHFMCGCQFVAHPGDVDLYKVEIRRPEDPIMLGVEDFDYRSEQYYLHVDPSVEILATTRFTGKIHPWIDGVVMPVVFKKIFGKGRVFYSSLGDSPVEFSHPEMRTIVKRGFSWAARQ